MPDEQPAKNPHLFAFGLFVLIGAVLSFISIQLGFTWYERVPNGFIPISVLLFAGGLIAAVVGYYVHPRFKGPQTAVLVLNGVLGIAAAIAFATVFERNNFVDSDGDVVSRLSDAQETLAWLVLAFYGLVILGSAALGIVIHYYSPDKVIDRALSRSR